MGAEYDKRPVNRVIGLIFYAVCLVIIQKTVVVTGFTPNENAIWLYSGFASLLFGSRLLNPHFTPPADAATNGFISFAAMTAALIAVPAESNDYNIICGVAVWSALICALSIVVLLFRPPTGVETREWIIFLDRGVRGLGSPITIFTVVIVACVWVFHRTRPEEVLIILIAWTIIVAIKPVEATLDFLEWVKSQMASKQISDFIGTIAAYQSPGMILIREQGDITIKYGNVLLILDHNDQWLLGLALNYVGRDDGNLLRVLSLTIPENISDIVDDLPPHRGNGLAFSLQNNARELITNPIVQNSDRLCGVVVSDTNLDYVIFEVTEGLDLSEGRLVETRVGGEPTIFQIIEGVTREDIVLQKNTYGYARAKARKIGRWDSDAKKFDPVKWLPNMNTPMFLIEDEAEREFLESIGHFPETGYGVRLNASEAVTHNTAILGILGIGKSYLSIELIERMIADSIKVICLDLTNQYENLLFEFIDDGVQTDTRARLTAAGRGGVANQNQEEGGSHQAFSNEVTNQLRNFLNPNNLEVMRVINPAEFEVTRQASGMYNNNANMVTLTPTEITAIVSDAALSVCQELGMTDNARACLVYEEAHSLVPEWNAVVAEGDKSATSRSARAILQGRKYGLGCLLITQRTASVTKTILNQCNTIFAMRTFDETGKDFLSNYIGSDYSRILSSLQARHAVFFGKASSCENPVLVRLNDRDDFTTAFRQVHPLPNGGNIDNDADDRPINADEDDYPF